MFNYYFFSIYLLFLWFLLVYNLSTFNVCFQVDSHTPPAVMPWSGQARSHSPVGEEALDVVDLAVHL